MELNIQDGLHEKNHVCMQVVLKYSILGHSGCYNKIS